MEKFKHMFCMVFVFKIVLSQSNNDCLTPNNVNGVCISLLICPELQKMWVTQTSTAVNYVRNSLCGYEGRIRGVCCPLKNESLLSWNNNNNTNNNNNNNNTNDNNYNTVSSNKLPLENMRGHTTIYEVPPHRVLVAGGRPAKLGAWPWMAALGYRNSNRPELGIRWKCGGSLISDRYVVTAAHCTASHDVVPYVVRLGDLNLKNNVNDGATPVDVPITRVLTHERFNVQEYTNDIALLKLENSVIFTKFIQPICLPVLSNLRNNSLTGEYTFFAGWGSTPKHEPASTTLMEVQLPVLDNDECKRLYANQTLVIDNRVLCAGYLTDKKDACKGDSGGPLMWPSGKQYYLVGIMSCGVQCDDPMAYPSVYTRVSSFVDWIAETMDNS